MSAGDFQFALDFTAKRPPAVQEAIAAGMAAADAHADSRWKHYFDGCVLGAAMKKSEITSDDVLAEIEALPNPPSTHNLAAIGPAMKRAAAMGILEYTDRVKRSERPDKHGNRQNVWKSKVYRP
jgi:hypothetical protein